MADQHPTDDPALSQAARHTLHDEELVAAYAADPDESEGATRAKAMIDRCATCASIAADIAAITGAMRSLGRAEAVAATIRAPRDFRLTAKDAARLGPVPVAAAASTPTPAPSSTPAPLDTQTPAGAPEPVPAQLSMAFEADEAAAVPVATPVPRPDRRPEPQPERAPAPGFFAGLATLLRPLGATLATFGLVGLLVGTVSLDPMGGAASAPGEDVGAGWPAPQATSAAEYQPGTSFDTGVVVTPLATDAVGRSNDDSAPLVATSALPSTSLILAGSALAVALGIGLFIAGSRAIRRQDGSRGG